MSRPLFQYTKVGPISPRHFQVFGERRSGTNYVAALIARNLALEEVFDYGWKHGFPVMPAIHPEGLIVICVRDPVDWLVSLHARPFEAPEMRDLEFSEFLRREWSSRYLPKVLNRFKFGLAGFRVTRRVPLQYDRHPIEGRAMRNVLELRTVKLNADLGMLRRDANAVVVRYEDVRSDPTGFVDQLSEIYEISRAQERLADVGRTGPRSERRIHRSEISETDLEFIWSNLDRDLEDRLGYTRQ